MVDRIFSLPDDSVLVTLSEGLGGERTRVVRISKTGVGMGDWYDPELTGRREFGSLLRGNELLLLTRRTGTPLGSLPSLSRADLQGTTLWSITLPTTLPAGKATEVQPNTLVDLPGPTMLIFSNLLQCNNVAVRYAAARVLGDDGATFCGPPAP